MSKINWKYEVGDVIKDEKRDMVIIDREIRNSFQYYKYHCNIDENEGWIYLGHLNKGARCNVCNKKINWKYGIGDVIKDERRNMTIIDRETRNKHKYYKYHCNKCGNEDWILESNLNKKKGCNVCSNRKAMLGVNTIWDTDRYLVTDYGLDEEFAKTHTIGVGGKGKFICKDCGNIKLCTPNKVKNNKSIGCSCGDKYCSYPEKFIYSMLKQLNMDFKFQLSKNNFKWIDTYRYDFYIPNLNLILEIHGEQHGEFIASGELILVKKGKRFNKDNKREEIKNDADKCWLAYDNGIDKYIQLDCSKSDTDCIKNSILNSELANIFDLNNIDWDKCNEFATKNIIKEVSDYWYKHKEINKESIGVKDLVKYFKISRSTIIIYLKKGTELGWCNYNPKEERKNTAKNNGKNNGKRVICIELNKIFISAKDAERELNINRSSITNVCRGKYKTAGGYHWKYVEEQYE